MALAARLSAWLLDRAGKEKLIETTIGDSTITLITEDKAPRAGGRQAA